jgi:hypothetical protein
VLGKGIAQRPSHYSPLDVRDSGGTGVTLSQQEGGAEGYATGCVAEPIKNMPHCSCCRLGLTVTGRDLRVRSASRSA